MIAIEIDFNQNEIDELIGRMKVVKKEVQKKRLETIHSCGLFIMRYVRSRIRSRKADKITFTPFLQSLAGTEINETPSEFLSKRRSVAPGQGRGGRKALQPKDQESYIWNKPSAEGEMPIAHSRESTSKEGKQVKDFPFKKCINFKIIDNNTVRIQAIPENREYKSMDMEALERGGSYEWRRRWVIGYRIENQRGGVYVKPRTNTDRPDPKSPWEWEERKRKNGTTYLQRVKRKGRLKNKTNRWAKTHFRKFDKLHVVLHRVYKFTKGRATIKGRPFLRLSIMEFMRNQWPKIWQEYEMKTNKEIK